MTIIYFTFLEGTQNSSKGIYETQVVQFLSNLQDNSKVLLVSVIKNTRDSFIAELCNKYDIPYKIYHYSNLFTTFKLKEKIKNDIDSYIIDRDGTIIYREVLGYFFMNYFCKNNHKQVIDKRGILHHEALTYSNKNVIQKGMRFIFYKLSEYYAFRNCSNFRFVSNQMKIFYTERYKKLFKNVIIQPTGVNLKRYNETVKNQSLSIIYAGGKSGYHLFDEILVFFKEISRFHRKANLCIISSFDDEELYTLRQEYPFIKFMKYLPHNELISILKSFHYGVCLREDSIINLISAPTKISEYLVHGLKVIYSGRIGIVEDLKQTTLSPLFIHFNDNPKMLQSFESLSDEQIKEVENKFLFNNQAKEFFKFLIGIK